MNDDFVKMKLLELQKMFRNAYQLEKDLRPKLILKGKIVAIGQAMDALGIDYDSDLDLDKAIECVDENKYWLIAEYKETKERYEKLKKLIFKIIAARGSDEKEPEHNSPLALLEDQKHYMELYLETLERRAAYELTDLF